MIATTNIMGRSSSTLLTRDSQTEVLMAGFHMAKQRYFGGQETGETLILL
jgi:hypothetical protein